MSEARVEPAAQPAPMDLVVVSGLSGAGKTVAIKALEDCGYYCVDHLPADVLEQTLASLRRRGETKVAIGLDPWDQEFVHSVQGRWEAALREGFSARVLILEASAQTLTRRYLETRRSHPLQRGGLSLTEALELERSFLLSAPRGAARIDTTDLSANSLKHLVKEFLDLKSAKMGIVVQSFGFKHGPCLEADMVFDARCLPNPYYQLELRPLTGKDEAVRAFFQGQPRMLAMADSICSFVEGWRSDYESDHRERLTVAIGCTGGQHRSVYLAEMVAERLAALGVRARARHRESDRWPKLAPESTAAPEPARHPRKP